MKIAIGSDHGGYEYKNELIAYLKELSYEIEDMGCYSTDSVDYSDVAVAVAESVVKGTNERGILICGTGIGMSIAANKVKGIRCALCSEPVSAQLTREHNDSNVLAMGQRVIGIELAKAIAKTWRETEFSKGERHQRRIDKISTYEANN